MYRQAQLKEDLPHTQREKKILIEVYGGRRNEIVRADLNKEKYRLRSECSAADAVSGVLLEEARRDIKIFLPLFIYRALHLRRVWVGITTTTCVRHWSQKIYNFPIVSVQHCSTCFPRKPQIARCMLACEQAHLFGWGASTKSWREEWGEVKWACTRAIDFWIPCVRLRTQRSDWFKLTGYRNQYNLRAFLITQTVCRLCSRSVPRDFD